MTLTELKKLKNKIDENIELLNKRDLYADNISDAIDILIDLDACQTMINIWYQDTYNELLNIQNAIKDIEEKKYNI